MFFVKKGILDQESSIYKFSELVSSMGFSSEFDPMFREFVSSFGFVAYPENTLSLDDSPLSLGDDLLTLE